MEGWQGQAKLRSPTLDILVDKLNRAFILNSD